MSQGKGERERERAVVSNKHVLVRGDGRLRDEQFSLDWLIAG